MAPRQEDFVFAERVLQHGYATEEQVQECLSLVDRLRAEIRIEEALRDLMVKKGYLAPAQASVLDAQDPARGRPKNAIEGYRLLERLGSGAMGSVYKAHHVKLDIPVALKVLRPSLASSRTQIERLKREAQLAARLNHPNVVRSLDVGESNGFHYLAMEFVEGATVRDLIGKGPVPEKDALAIVRQVAAGLAHAHAEGVVHRDVKPGNIMLTSDGTAKLGDFGLARGEAPSDLTLEHASIGTPQYVAPEQMRRGSDATPRSDLFSLGATLYHMVTGRPPFDGESLGEIVQNVLVCRFQPAEALVPGLSRDAVYLIDRLMRAHPKERYASAAELVADLDRIATGAPLAPPDFLGDYQAFLKRRRGRRKAIVAACVAVVAGAAAVVLVRASNEKERERRAELCRVANRTRADAASLEDLARLRGALEEMKEAAATGAECPAGDVADLRARIKDATAAAQALETAERLARRAGEADANFVGIDGTLGKLAPVLPGAAKRVGEIRDDVRRKSKAAAQARYERQCNEGFPGIEAAQREAKAFASDLESRYLPGNEPWLAEVAQAPRLLDDLARSWQDLAVARQSFEAELAGPRYNSAARANTELQRHEDAALDAIRQSTYLKSLLRLSANDRALRLDLAERSEWNKVRARVSDLVDVPEERPDTAEGILREFEARANVTQRDAFKLLKDVEKRRDTLEKRQLFLLGQEKDAREQKVRERRYTGAYEGLEELAQSGALLDGVRDQYRALRDRARGIAELRDRFLERVPKEKFKLGGKEVLGDRVEPAPGEDKDLFVAKGAKGATIEFTLADLSREDLERILAFRPADKASRGRFYAAEAYREDASDLYRAETLRADALRDLAADDPWTAEIVEERKATLERIRKGEERAERAYADLTAAEAAQDIVMAHALAKELVETLAWTSFFKLKEKLIRDAFDRLSRVVAGGALQRRAGVPESQFLFGGSDRPTTIHLTGRLWHPDEALVPKDAPDRVALLDHATDRLWTDRFTRLGFAAPEIALLVQRAKHQLLLWNGPVETGPEGGYLPAAGAVVPDFADWQVPGDPATRRPLEIGLDFPFRADAPWRIEFEVRWPTPQPGLFVVALGKIQAVVGYYDAGTYGGMAGACLLLSEDLDPNAHRKELDELAWHVVNPEEGKPPRRPTEGGEKAYLEKGSQWENVPYRIVLERTAANRIRFELSTPEGKKIVLERRDWTPQQLDRDACLPSPRFRFFGVPPAKGKAYELHDVKITGMVPEQKATKQ